MLASYFTLLELVQEKKQRYMERRWKFKLSNGEVIVIRDLFEKVVGWLQKFKEVGDIAVQYDPVHAALPWAGVRLLLQVVVNDTETLGAVAEGLETVSHLIARCALYEGIYLAPSTQLSQKMHVELVEALTVMYTVILQWLSKAGSYYAMSAGKRFLSSAVSPAPTLVLIAEKERKVNDLAAAIQSQLVSGTAQAVKVLVTNSSSLFDLMQDLEKPILRVLKPDPLVILGSILKQLATSEGSESVHQSLWEEFSSRSEQAEQDGSRPFPLSFEECQDFILAITSNNPVTIIVDGLDEADGDVRDLLNSFRHIVEESRENVKLFISCRDDMDTVPIHLQTEEIRITRQENSEDIGILERLAIENADMDWDAKNNAGLSGTYLSAQYGRHDALRFFLSHGANIGKIEGRFGTPIQAAAFHGHTETVKILLQHGADALASGQFSTALHAAIEGGHEAVVDLLACEDSSHHQSDLRDLVKAASYNGYHTAIRALLRQHIQSQPNMSDTSQGIHSRIRSHTYRHDSPLRFKEAIPGSNDILQAALYGISSNGLPLSVVDNITNINESGGLFGNALQAACFGGSAQWVHVLLERGADVNSVGNAGSALRAASLGGHDAVVKLLLGRKATLGPDERDALEACALKNRLSTLRLLVDHFNLKNITDYSECKRYFNAAMRTARRQDRYQMVVFMVENGAGLLRRDMLKDAAKGGQEAITNFLRSTDNAPHSLLDIYLKDTGNVTDRLLNPQPPPPPPPVPPQ
ncbi:ankyrin repeat protein [Colletotrichum chrysophilum]|uniref:Ankyrin repeat protein n=1 Tax=Colletotrichum chrysophilum TaxID=1836956 RepID=A0AAD9EMB2_9PEZI|nr:ankyrin repeat protein [Colletotrichum chrysophilum]